MPGKRRGAKRSWCASRSTTATSSTCRCPGRAALHIASFSAAWPPGSHVVRAELDRELTAAGVSRPGHRRRIDRGRADRREPRRVSRRCHWRRSSTRGRIRSGTFNDVPLFMWYEVEPEAERDPLPLLGDLHERRRRHADRSTDGDLGPHDRHRISLQRRRRSERRHRRSGHAGSRARDAEVPAASATGSTRCCGSAPRTTWCSIAATPRSALAPAPVAFPLRDISREAVMDANPWLYDVMSRELAREGKIVADAPPGNDTIPDPRRFVYLEGCGEAGDRAIAFAIGTGAADAGALTWHASDRGTTQYRIVRERLLPRGDAAARRTDAGRRARRARAGLRSGRPCRCCRGAPDAHQQAVHARRQVRAWRVGSDVAGRRGARARRRTVRDPGEMTP